MNAKQTRELDHLEAYYNKDAETIWDEARVQENQLDQQLAIQEDVLTAEFAAQPGRDMATFGMEETTIEQAFSNDYVRDAIMENVDPEKMEEPVKNDREMELFNELKIQRLIWWICWVPPFEMING